MKRLPIVPHPDAATSRREMVNPIDGPSATVERRDLRDDDLQPLLEAFYIEVETEPLLAPYFVAIDMRAHMPRIVDFWSTLLFHTGRYTGNAFRPHLAMPGLAAEHFTRWVATLERTIDARFAGSDAERMKDYARRIAHTMQLRLGITPTEVHRTQR